MMSIYTISWQIKCVYDYGMCSELVFKYLCMLLNSSVSSTMYAIHTEFINIMGVGWWFVACVCVCVSLHCEHIVYVSEFLWVTKTSTAKVWRHSHLSQAGSVPKPTCTPLSSHARTHTQTQMCTHAAACVTENRCVRNNTASIIPPTSLSEIRKG